MTKAEWHRRVIVTDVSFNKHWHAKWTSWGYYDLIALDIRSLFWGRYLLLDAIRLKRGITAFEAHAHIERITAVMINRIQMRAPAVPLGEDIHRRLINHTLDRLRTEDDREAEKLLEAINWNESDITPMQRQRLAAEFYRDKHKPLVKKSAA